MLFALAWAALVAAAPLDAPHAAVLTVLSQSGDAAACDAAQQRKAAAGASIRTLGRVEGDAVVLALVADPCICGAQNCPYLAIRLTPGKPRVLMSTFGIGEREIDRAKPLPALVVAMHDSAMVADETTFAYRNGSYVATDSVRVRQTDHARKPNGIPVRFAAGASSSQLRGSASLGWYDVYVFDAAKGQLVVVDDVHSRAKITLAMYGPRDAVISGVRAGAPITLPATGTYRLQIEASSEDDAAYTARLSIR
jgi:hypothetical protein